MVAGHPVVDLTEVVAAAAGTAVMVSTKKLNLTKIKIKF